MSENNTQLQLSDKLSNVATMHVDSIQDDIRDVKIIEKKMFEIILKEGSEWATNPLFLLSVCKYKSGAAIDKTRMVFDFFMQAKLVKPLAASNEIENIEGKNVIDVDLSQIPVEEREALRNT